MGNRKKPTRNHSGTRTSGQGGHWIFRRWITDPKTGERRFPPPGKKAWPIWVDDDDDGDQATKG